jgi:hypothetical protein
MELAGHSMAMSKREQNYRTRYGISLSDYDDIWAAQAGTCAICGATSGQPGRPGSLLFVDHDHVTGAVRGLLCRPCNSGLGMFQDDPQNLARAAIYLKYGAL